MPTKPPGDESTLGMTDDERTAVNAARLLVVDAIERCGNGHPGAALALAPLAFVLWSEQLKYDPGDPDWVDRDRFVLSNGHAAALLYSALHLSGYDLSLDDLRSLRQMGSKTPAHPELHVTPGVDVTTGPLGQGIGCAVGMALEERRLRERITATTRSPIDHRIWVVAGDGDMMEGVASEACSLAGHLALNHLTVFYDDNRVTIDGSIDLSFSEDVRRRFQAYGWKVLNVSDVNNLGQLRRACRLARRSLVPTLVTVRTTIAFGAPHAAGQPWTHGTALGAAEAAATRTNLGFSDRPFFDVPEIAYQLWRSSAKKNAAARRRWDRTMAALLSQYPCLAEEVTISTDSRLAPGWDKSWLEDVTSPLSKFSGSTREASGRALNHAASLMPHLVGGSADLSSTTFTLVADEPPYSRARASRQIHFGVREHAMAAAANGLALEGARPFVSTFLAFSDYLRPSIRLACLMRLPVIYLFTHDSVGLAGDGPTHQPIEHLASLRAIPNLVVLRPSDGAETAEAWRIALDRGDGPTAIVLSRQPLPAIGLDAATVRAGTEAGAYTVFEAPADGRRALDLVLVASGSEVHIAIGAAKILHAEGAGVRTVSMPSWELFRRQDRDYRDAVLPPNTKRLAIEAASVLGWTEWVGDPEAVVGITTYGCCGQGEEVLERFGFTEAAIARRARALL